jgi:RNA polymerase sigma-70 factor (ECF subfamily)
VEQSAPADLLSVFEAQRPRLIGLGYRMLGTVADAEDIVQEAWLRWQRGDRSEVDNPEAYLTTVTTRLALDRLRRVKAQREVYPGSWLPEPVALDDPAATVEQKESLSLAVLVLLETLSPLERAAFVLHEVFEEPYAEVAATLGREEATVRQLVSRARRHVEGGRPRYPVDPAQRDRAV